ncbi:MAG: hypothetical protein E6J39_09320, partial [Chloroflexi bacterium]
EHGIGRPSTYAPTMETIRKRGYVTVEDRRLHPTESAERVTDLLVEHFPEVVDLDFTARMEEQLDDVARGTNAWVPMVRGFWEPFNEKLVEGRTKIAKQVELTDIVCPVSGDFMVKRFGRNGWFLGCSAYPECKHTMPLPGAGHARRRRGLSALRPGAPGGEARALWPVRRLRPLPRMPLHQEGRDGAVGAVRHVSQVRARHYRHQALTAGWPALLGLRPISRMRLLDLDTTGGCRDDRPRE